MNGLTHPGGLEITKKAFDVCGLPKLAKQVKQVKVLDIGCGCGDTAAYLENVYGFCVTGIDSSAEAIFQARGKHPGIEFMEGDGQSLDFGSLSFDCVLMECTLSLMPNPVEAIHEAFCVLREGGYLVMHDLYLPHPSREDFEAIAEIRKSKEEHKREGRCGEERRSVCAVNGALVLKDIDAALDELGFETILFEDRKSDLDSYAASLIFNGGDMDDCFKTKQSKSQISYYLMIARKAKK